MTFLHIQLPAMDGEERAAEDNFLLWGEGNEHFQLRKLKILVSHRAVP